MMGATFRDLLRDAERCDAAAYLAELFKVPVSVLDAEPTFGGIGYTTVYGGPSDGRWGA